MFKLIDLLLHGCWHKWKVIKECAVWEADKNADKPMGYQYILQCEKCGRIHHHNTY